MEPYRGHLQRVVSVQFCSADQNKLVHFHTSPNKPYLRVFRTPVCFKRTKWCRCETTLSLSGRSPNANICRIKNSDRCSVSPDLFLNKEEEIKNVFFYPIHRLIEKNYLQINLDLNTGGYERASLTSVHSHCN